MKILIKFFILLSGITGAFFGFFYVILGAINEINQDHLYLISYIAFFGSLLLFVLGFFFNRRFKLFYSILLFTFSILYLILYFSMPNLIYFFLAPTVLYLFSTILTFLYNWKNT